MVGPYLLQRDTMAKDPVTYDTDGYRKHKRPEGWGSLCPEDLEEDPQTLLRTGVAIDDDVYNVSGEYALLAHTHAPDKWHGFPIPWSRLPAEAKNKLIEAGRLDNVTFRKALRKSWGREFDR